MESGVSSAVSAGGTHLSNRARVSGSTDVGSRRNRSYNSSTYPRLRPVNPCQEDILIILPHARTAAGGGPWPGALLTACCSLFTGWSFGDAERSPVRCPQVLREKHDLADVIRDVCQRAIDRLHDGVPLAADEDVAREIVGLQRLQRGEQLVEARVPVPENHLARRARRHFELAITMPIRL